MRYRHFLPTLVLTVQCVAQCGCDLGSPDDSATTALNDVDFLSIDDPTASLIAWEAQGAIAKADVNGDGIVNIIDLVVVAQNFGHTVDFPPVKVATFNIQAFGEAKRSKPEVMDLLVEVADEFQIMAVQEIRDGSLATPYVYLEAMNATGDEMHSVTVGPRLGRTTSKEQYAFYYDMRFVQLMGKPATYPDADDVFEREPLAARFSAGGFDFVLVNVHVKPDDADAEIRALADVVAWAEGEFQDADVIVLGDLNADCDYFDEAERQAAGAMNWITPDDFDTTVKGTVCTYDNFLLSDSLMDEFSGEIEVFRFDTEYGLDQPTAEDVSDHYPVFAVFSVGQ